MRTKPLFVVPSFVFGGSARTMRMISYLWLHPGMRVADVTYGCGVFWKEIDTDLYDFHPSDLVQQPETGHKVAKYDFRKLPYENRSFNAAAFDPPWRAHRVYSHEHEFGRRVVDRFGAAALQDQGNSSTEDILRLYQDGMTECHRILRRGGRLIVKCQDMIDGGGQYPMEIQVWKHAVKTLGMIYRDKFFSASTKYRPLCHHHQEHSRRNYSVFWVFERADGIRGTKRATSSRPGKAAVLCPSST